ncbi:MAG: type II CAAX endopeptidase family protein [Bacteroidota bacterium]
MSKSIFLSIYTIAGFLLATYGQDILQHFGVLANPIRGIAPNLLHYFIWYLLIPGIFVGLMHGWKKILYELGLQASVLRALRFALFCVAPMIIGGALLCKMDLHWSWTSFLFGSLLAGICEEVLYRGFLFGQLYRRASWPFVPAGLVSALIFGSMHLYQGETWQEALGVFGVTLAGGLWFSWLYVRWNYNLWVPIFLHLLMNLSWMVFSLGDNAMGSLWPNILRIGTIAISVYLTIRYTEKIKGHKERQLQAH